MTGPASSPHLHPGERAPSSPTQMAPAEPVGLFAELRRKLACGETLARAVEKLLEALRFSGRITLTFHQGKLTKTVLEESYIRSRTMT